MTFTNRKAFCPRCDSSTRQTFIEKYFYAPGSEEADDRLPEAYFFFSCNNCGGLLLYEVPALIRFVAEIEQEKGFDYLDITEILQDERVQESLELIWPEVPLLAESVPTKIKDLYREAIKVKKSSPKAFAILIGKALDEICMDMGTTERMLGDKLTQLKSHGALPNKIIKVARKIADIRNTAAHTNKGNISPKQTRAIEDFFRLIIDYVYVVRPKLSNYRDILLVAPESSNDDELVH